MRHIITIGLFVPFFTAVCEAQDPADHKLDAPFWGAKYKPLTEVREIAEELGSRLPRSVDEGAALNMIVPGSPMAKAGFKRNDVVVQIDDDKFEEGKVEAHELVVVPGTGKIPISQKCDFYFELVDGENRLLARYGIWNPRILITDEDDKTGFVEVPSAIFAARFPFTVKAKEIRVLNAQKKVLAGQDVRAAIKEFCSKFRDHPRSREKRDKRGTKSYRKI